MVKSVAAGAGSIDPGELANGLRILNVPFEPAQLPDLLGLVWPWASLPLSADIHLRVLNNSYDRMYL